MILLLAIAAALSLSDTYVTYKRIKAYGSFAEINIAIRQLTNDFGLNVGIVFGLVYNLLLIGLLGAFGLKDLLLVLIGAKAGLVLMQLKSLQMEGFVERVLAKARAKRDSQARSVTPSTPVATIAD